MTTNNEMPAGKPSHSELHLPKNEPFRPDKADVWLSLTAFPLGFLFVRLVFFHWRGWGVSLYTGLFIAAVLFYMRQKEKKMSGETWFWFAILLFTGLSFSLWPGRSIFGWRALLLLGAAIYWVRLAAGAALCGKTSNWLPLDLLHSIVYTPMENFSAQYHSLAVAGKGRGKTAVKIWPVVLGILLAAILISAVVPLLMQADAGGFRFLLLKLLPRLERVGQIDPLLLIQLVLSIPVAAYIFGLLAGSIHGRRVNLQSAGKYLAALRILPSSTVITSLILLNGLYITFIASQLPYLFTVFHGIVPPGWESYAEFARRGFFELCIIAVINMFVLTGTHLGIEIKKPQSALLNALSAMLPGLTLALAAIAFSKLALYVGIFGLTAQRLLPGVFLLFLAIVFGALLVWQKKRFSIMRLAAFTGVILLCLLCVINTDALVAGYNANRYLSGTLNEFDTVVLYRAGTAGVSAALLLYEQSDDPQLHKALNEYLAFISRESSIHAGTLRDTWHDALVRRKLRH